jgi:hypothetical protein
MISIIVNALQMTLNKSFLFFSKSHRKKNKNATICATATEKFTENIKNAVRTKITFPETLESAFIDLRFTS